MRGKREALRFYADETQPRKRMKEKGDNLIHLSYEVYADDIRVQDVVEFINQNMKREFNSSAGVFVKYNAAQNGEGWILEATSTDLANKVCNLNGIYYKCCPLKIQKYGVSSSPNNWCWNDFCLKRYGKNSHFADHHIMATVLKSEEKGCAIADSILQTKLNEKMQEFKLASTNVITNAVKIKCEGDNDRFLLNMSTRHHATRLTYLNYICIDNLFVTLKRLPEWKGEEPRYKNYDEFLKDFQLDEANRAQPKQVHVPSMGCSKMDEHPRISTSSEVEEASNSFANPPPPSETSDMEISVSTEEEGGELNPSWTIYQGQSTGEVGARKTVTRDDHVVQESVSKPTAAVGKSASVMTIMQEDDKNLERIIAENGRMKDIIEKQTSNTKDLRDSLEIANEKLSEKDAHIAQLEQSVNEQKKELEENCARRETLGKKTSARMKLINESLAQKDQRIAQLENIVGDQRKDIDDQRRKVSSKEVEIETLRENLAFQKKDMEKQDHSLRSKEEETARLKGNVTDLSDELENTVMKLDAVHQDWGSQVLQLEAKDKQIAVLQAKLEKVRDAFLWHPDMNGKEKAKLQKKWKETVED